MVYVIMGGSGSGKSAYAEELMCKIAAPGQRFYLATMQAFGEEGRKRVERHRRQRGGRGFQTIEKAADIGELLFPSQDASVLLECMSNLTANEMFTGQGIRPEEDVVKKVCSDVEILAGKVRHLVIVANNVFEDGVRYEEETMAYLRALGEINRRIILLADAAVEVVYSIPLFLKGENKCRY